MRLLPSLSVSTSEQTLFWRALSSLWTFSSTKAPSVPAFSTCKRRGRIDDLGYVVIEVESVAHRLPGHRLADFSDAFTRIIYEARQRDPDAEPRIAIDECTNHEFESVLEIIYPLRIPYPELDKRQLVAALSLSVQWEMNGVKEFVIGRLLKHGLPSIEKIDLGRRFKVQAFLEQGCIELVRNSSVISPDEIKRIGWDTYGLISFVRQKTNQALTPVSRSTSHAYGGCSWPSTSRRSIGYFAANTEDIKCSLVEGEQMDAYIWSLLEEQGIRK